MYWCGTVKDFLGEASNEGISEKNMGGRYENALKKQAYRDIFCCSCVLEAIMQRSTCYCCWPGEQGVGVGVTSMATSCLLEFVLKVV
jgi:hypothetical protein